jgi:hypothetical protein
MGSLSNDGALLRRSTGRSGGALANLAVSPAAAARDLTTWGGVGVTSHAARMSETVIARSRPQFFTPSFLSKDLDDN